MLCRETYNDLGDYSEHSLFLQGKRKGGASGRTGSVNESSAITHTSEPDVQKYNVNPSAHMSQYTMSN